MFNNIFKKKQKDSPDQTIEKLIKKYEAQGYNHEVIKTALSRCPNPIKEAAFLEALKRVSSEGQISEKFLQNAYKKYGEMGYDREAINAALKSCANIYNESLVIETLNRIVRERMAYSDVQINQKFIANAYKKYEELGFSRTIISKALERCPNAYNENLMLDTLNSITKDQNLNHRSLIDENLNNAIMESIETAKRDNKSYETANPLERKRKNGVPVGLKNIGNTCYFNSMLQTYFMNHKFVKEIIEFQEDSKKTLYYLLDFSYILNTNEGT